ncbi:MAG: AlpA family transcriptional regulator [Moraxellaceae bacterium]|nr:AlpA family transcriptional regulator [Moraxellaceae bacterium]
MIILRLKDVMACTGLGRSSVYKFITEGRFPKPVALGDRAVGWVEEEVQDWIRARVAARDGKTVDGQLISVTEGGPHHV